LGVAGGLTGAAGGFGVIGPIFVGIAGQRLAGEVWSDLVERGLKMDVADVPMLPWGLYLHTAN
jgi:hypothetical protein